MTKTLEFCFDFGSPTTYLAWTQLPRLAEETGAEIVQTPVLLGGLFKATGNQGPAMVPAKGKHMFTDLTRFAKHYGVPLAFNPNFPINTLLLQRGAVALQGIERYDDYLRTIYEAMWVEPKNLNDPMEVAKALSAGGFDPQELMALASQPEVKETLKANTERAVARGAFGAPTFFVGEEMFFGQDRLDFVIDALRLRQG